MHAHPHLHLLKNGFKLSSTKELERKDGEITADRYMMVVCLSIEAV